MTLIANVLSSRRKFGSPCLSLFQGRLTNIQLFQFRHPNPRKVLDAVDVQLAKRKGSQILELYSLQRQVLTIFDLDLEMPAFPLIHFGTDGFHLPCGTI